MGHYAGEICDDEYFKSESYKNACDKAFKKKNELIKNASQVGHFTPIMVVSEKPSVKPILNFQWKDDGLYLGELYLGTTYETSGKFVPINDCGNNVSKLYETIEEARKALENWATKQILGE